MMSRNRRTRTGFSYLEVMLNLAIVSVLLMGVTTSLRGLLGQFRGNESVLRSRRAATVVLDYLLTGLRQAKDINFGDPTHADEHTFTQAHIVDYFDRARPLDLQWRTVRWNKAEKKLLQSVSTVVTVNGTKQVAAGPERTVLDNVVDFKFRAKPEYDVLLEVATWRSVTVDITIETIDPAGKRVPTTFSGTTYARSVPLD